MLHNTIYPSFFVLFEMMHRVDTDAYAVQLKIEA